MEAFEENGLLDISAINPKQSAESLEENCLLDDTIEIIPTQVKDAIEEDALLDIPTATPAETEEPHEENDIPETIPTETVESPEEEDGLVVDAPEAIPSETAESQEENDAPETVAAETAESHEENDIPAEAVEPPEEEKEEVLVEISEIIPSETVELLEENVSPDAPDTTPTEDSAEPVEENVVTNVPTKSMKSLKANESLEIPDTGPTQDTEAIEKNGTVETSDTVSAEEEVPDPTVYDPTVVPHPDFDASEDANVLRTAMKGLGTDEAAIIEIVTNRSNRQRQEITNAFSQEFERDLMDDFKRELKINGNFRKVIVGLMKPPVAYLADELHSAMGRIGTDCDALTEIICTRPNYELKEIVETYEEQYNEPLVKALESEVLVSGDYLHLLSSLIQESLRDDDDNDGGEDPDKAKNQAEVLFEEAGKSSIDHNVFVELLARESLDHLRKICLEWKGLYAGGKNHRTLEAAVKMLFSGKSRTAMLTRLKCAESKARYYSDKLELAMKGFGTDDSALIRIIISRSELDLGLIKKVYQETYERSLYEAVDSETSGDYRKGILNIIKP